MRKAIIPMAIAAIFGLGGVIVYSTGTYVPETVTLEGDGGTDEKVETLDDVSKAFSVAALSRGSAYYSALMMAEEDPEPLPEGNSIGVTCNGYYDNNNGTSYNRKLIIAQNERGLNYHYDGWQNVSGTKTTLDYLVSVSRHGMFVKYNSHAISSEDELDELQIQLSESMNRNRGKWFTVDVNEAHMKEAEEIAKSGDMSKYMRAMVISTCAAVATQYQSQFLNVVDTNNGQIKELASIIESAKGSAEQSGSTYKMSNSNLSATVNLTSKTSPEVILDSLVNSKEKQHQEITLCHINNTKVNIVEGGQGDFVDLFGDAIANYLNKSMN